MDHQCRWLQPGRSSKAPAEALLSTPGPAAPTSGALQVVFHSPQQQHDFNFPYQIGSVDSMSDPPQAAQRFELVVQPGDVLVIGTDGLWDNCFDEEILSVIRCGGAWGGPGRAGEARGDCVSPAAARRL